MEKVRFSGVLAVLLCGIPVVADAVYPAYQTGYQNPVNSQYVYLPSANNGVIVANSNTAAKTTRVTGQLPKVGSTAVAAGRRYYQASDYDRLADSGLYVGLSAAYTASLSGTISADYTGEENAFFVPGAFNAANFNSDTVIPLQISVGASINNNLRADFSYLRYSDIAYPNTVETSDGAGGYVEASVDGGAITSNITMLNLYYNIDSYTGYLAGGELRPYIGVGVGMALNTIADYVVLDSSFYSEADPAESAAGTLTGISDIYAYHNGGTTEQLAYMLEAGVTTDMDGGIKIDFYARYMHMGKIKTSGSVVVSQTEWLADGSGSYEGEYEAPYDSVFHYTNWYESGSLSSIDIGARLRLQF